MWFHAITKVRTHCIAVVNHFAYNILLMVQADEMTSRLNIRISDIFPFDWVFWAHLTLLTQVTTQPCNRLPQESIEDALLCVFDTSSKAIWDSVMNEPFATDLCAALNNDRMTLVLCINKTRSTTAKYNKNWRKECGKKGSSQPPAPNLAVYNDFGNFRYLLP